MKRYVLPLFVAALLFSGNVLRAQTCSNLVTNPNGTGGLTDWTFVNSGDNGIAALTDNGTDCFIFSYALDSMTQVIDLSNTYSSAQLEIRPNITFSEQLKTYSAASCSNSPYNVSVTLEDSLHNVLETWTTGLQTTSSNSVWDTLAHSFVAYNGVPRYVTIMNSGQDCASQTGNYGVAFTAVSLTALIPTSTYGAASAKQHPNSVISYDDASSCLQTGVVLQTATDGLGNTTVQSFEDTAVNTHNGQPYIQRHFEIAPSAQHNATVTFYIDQAHFDAYNLARGSALALPATGDTSDPALANLIITAFHGTPTGGFDPGNYPVTTRELIPNNAITKVWNADAARWEFSFTIASFSGFFLSGGSGTPLDIHMGDLALTTRNSRHSLNWATYNEAANDYFIMERSANGHEFSAITRMSCSGKAGNYAYTDAATPAGTSYYRLKLVSGKTGTATYSNVVSGQTATAANDAVTVFPNPAADGILNIRLNGADGSASLLTLSDATGRELKRLTAINAQVKMDVRGIPAGMYLLGYSTDGGVRQTIKVTVQ